MRHRREARQMTFFAPIPWVQTTSAARAAHIAYNVAVAYFSAEGPSPLLLRSGSLLIADTRVETPAAGASSRPPFARGCSEA